MSGFLIRAGLRRLGLKGKYFKADDTERRATIASGEKYLE
jgi:hypothetical protein